MQPNPVHPDVVICIEHVARELSIASLLSKIAEEQFGMQIAIVSLLTPVEDWPDEWNPSVICVPYFYSRKDFAIKDILTAFPDASVVNLAYEQHLSKANQNFKCPRDEYARMSVTHLASGKSFRQYLLKSGVSDDRVTVIGNLPCTLYQPPYRSRFSDKKAELARKHDLPLDRPWLMFPENFAAAFFRRSHKRQRLKSGFSKQHLNDYIASSQYCFRMSMDWLAKLPVADRCQIIIRPRPAVSESFFEERILRAIGRPLDSSIRLIKEGDVRPWILASDAVISGISSTLVEAASAGKPIGTLEPSPLPPSVRSEWTAYAPSIGCLSDLECLVDYIVDSRVAGPNRSLAGRLSQRPIGAWVRAEMLGCDDAVVQCVRVLNQSVSDSQTKRRKFPLGKPNSDLTTYRSARSLTRSLGQVICNLNPFKRAKIFGHQLDTITSEMISDERSQWNETLNQSPLIKTAA